MVAVDRSSLELLGSLAGTGWFEVDGERNVVAVSAELEAITGFRAEEVLGRPCITLLRCPDCLKQCAVLRRGRLEQARVRIYRKDGGEVEVIRAGAAMRDAGGGFVGALETVRLAEGAGCPAGVVPQELDVLLRGLGRLFVAADEQLRVRAFSPSLVGFTGWPEESLQRSTLAELFGEHLFGPDGELAAAVREGRRREGWQASLPAPGGGRHGVSCSVGPIAPEDRCGHPDVRVVVMIRPDESAAEEPGETAAGYRGIVGRSPGMQRIFRLIELLRDNDSTVLITGESGTGKGMIARTLHETSHRARGPFVAVNCAALPAELLESELFGHVRGAFTSAVRDRIGRFELAHGGTIFLDEIGDLAPNLQGKILRVIQERTFERVGDTRTRTTDVRVIAATHLNLARAVADKRFREDLYYRLRVIPVEIPPLRARREDLPALVDAVLLRIGRNHQRGLRLASAASRALLAYDWPGNVRELENALEYAVAVCPGQTIHLDDLPHEIRFPLPGFRPAPDPAPAPPTEPASPERDRLADALDRAHYRRAEAARLLGISRTTLWRKLREHGL